MATHFRLDDLPEALLVFVTERHLATLTTLRPDGTPHVVPVGFTLDVEAGLARVITFAGSKKVRNLRERPGSPAVLCQVDGGRWLSIEGAAVARDDPDANAEGVRRYAERYRQPKDRPDRVTIELRMNRILGNV